MGKTGSPAASRRLRARLAASLSMCLMVLPIGCSRSCNDNADPTDPDSCSYGQYPETTPAPALEGFLVSTKVRDEERGIYEMNVRFSNESDSPLELPRCVFHANYDRGAPLQWTDDAPVEPGEEAARIGVARFGRPVRFVDHPYFGCEGGQVKAEERR